MNTLFGPMAHARNTDPDTSMEAAIEITPRIRQLQAEVLGFAAGRDRFTDLDLNTYFQTNSSTYRTRRSELVALGFIGDTGERIGEGKGRRHAVWKITPEGKAKVDDLLNVPRAA